LFFAPSSLFLPVFFLYLLSQMWQPKRHSNFTAGRIAYELWFDSWEVQLVFFLSTSSIPALTHPAYC
jgi:hypothetical protein